MFARVDTCTIPGLVSELQLCRKQVTLYPREMFTGLVETTGSVVSAESTGGAMRVVLSAPSLAGRWKQGDSLAVNGVCLTALPLQPEDSGVFAADLAAETVARTTLGALQSGSVVNLELPTPAGSPLGGHVVQGHVDGVGQLVSLVPLGPDPVTADWRMTISLTKELAVCVIPQGSITVDGISLTVAAVHPTDAGGHTLIEIAVIPHTYRSTHLRTLIAGAFVNIETDVLAKYAQRAGATKAQKGPEPEWLTGAYLMANGY